MATLNLTPNPIAVATQAVLFIANVFIVKKLMLEPYLKIRARRDALTVGSKDEAIKFVASTTELNAQITKRMQDAHSSIKVEVEAIRAKASSERAGLIGVAEKSAKESLTKLQASIVAALNDERQKMPAIAKAIAHQFAEKVLS